MAFLDPAIAIIVSLCFLVILLYKRVNLGIVLNATALLLAVLALDWTRIPTVVYETTIDPLTVSVVLATFGIMFLSQLYKETGLIDKLSESISRIIKSPKIVLSVIPAVIGLLPVAGGALMSAPLVDREAEKLDLKTDRKAYINLWFRHTVFPVYPLSPPIITTALLTGVAIPLIILRQIPVVLVMVIAGYVIGFWKITGKKQRQEPARTSSDLKTFLVSFTPILTTIVAAIALNLTFINLSQQGFDVIVATFMGIVALAAISKPNEKTIIKPLKTWGIYGITFAAYGAFLLRSTINAVGISQIFSNLVSSGSIDVILLLTLVPAVLGLLTGSPGGGVAISVPILAGILSVTPPIAALIYISAYLGYTVAPTHLCFTFTAEYFKCPLGRIYRYVVPSFLATFAAAILVYFLI